MHTLTSSPGYPRATQPVLSRLDALLLNSVTRNGRAAMKHIDAAAEPDAPDKAPDSVDGRDHFCMLIVESAIDWRGPSAPARYGARSEARHD